MSPHKIDIILVDESAHEHEIKASRQPLKIYFLLP